MKTIILARFTFREAVRKKAVLGGAILTGIFLLLYTFGTYLAFGNIKAPPEMRQSVNGELLLAGLYFVNFIAGLLAIFSSVGTISSEIEQGTLHAVVPKPIRRWEVVVGKWLGFATMVAIYVTVTSLAVVAIIWLQTGYFPGDPVIGIGVMVIQALLLLSLSILGTCAFSTITNGIVVFMLYALALSGGRLEQLGTLIHNQTLVNIGIAISLAIPSDALWRLASARMGAGGFINQAGASQPGLFSVSEAPSVWMVAYAITYAAIALVVACLIFRRKDL